MYASASTWAFNVVRQILQASEAQSFRAVFTSGTERRIDWSQANGVTVIKSHEINGEERILDIARRSSKLLITLRDPRDCIVSLMQAQNFDFSRALTLVEQSAALCASFAKDRRSRIFRFETSFFKNPANVTEIANHLGYTIEKRVAEAIHHSLTRGEVEKYIDKLPEMQGILRDRITGDLLDPKTQWHSHHAGRNGEIGKWEMVLSTEQLTAISTLFEPYSSLIQAPISSR
jgi:hypothetical protein